MLIWLMLNTKKILRLAHHQLCLQTILVMLVRTVKGISGALTSTHYFGSASTATTFMQELMSWRPSTMSSRLKWCKNSQLASQRSAWSTFIAMKTSILDNSMERKQRRTEMWDGNRRLHCGRIKLHTSSHHTQISPLLTSNSNLDMKRGWQRLSVIIPLFPVICYSP